VMPSELGLRAEPPGEEVAFPGAAAGPRTVALSGFANGTRVATGSGAEPFEDLDELAERVGVILQEEARRSGIDV
ncbi:MAG: hypothetical protein M3217_00300, partial [Actinomycetota bacterium]|nr:hypothetical protein [Actinomycetota bacterium]